MNEPSAEQLAVIESSDSKIVVSASAGAGKTFVLVERYLQLLLKRESSEDLRPDNILTITFTRKAAAEMKSRIVSRLHQAGLDNDAQIAETGPIQTIHSFCQRVLSENAIEAGLDPNFRIIDEADLKRLREDILLDVLSDPYDDDPEVQALVELLAGGRVFGNNTPQAALQKYIEEALQKLRGSGSTPDELQALYATPESTLEHWHKCLLLELDPRVTQEIDPNTPLEDQIYDLHKSVKATRPGWVRKASDDRMPAIHTTAFVRLVVAVWRRLEAAMRSRSELDFTLLEQMAVDLVESDERVRSRLQRQYRVVFVDEAQDLNPVQYRLLTSLKIDTELMVGDAQQSIYGFRLADRQLFVDRQNTEGQKSLTLNRNYRSEPGILAFVDHIFRDRWGDAYRAMAPAPKIETTSDGNVVHLNFGETPTYENVEVWPMAQPDSTRVAELLKQVLAETGRPNRDVCILVRTGNQALALQTSLSKVGIPSEVIGANEQYFTRLEVRDVSNALRWLSDPHDNYAALAVLRSPFVDITLDAFVQLARRRRDGPSIYEQIIEATGNPLESSLADDDIGKLWELRRWFDDLATHADRLSAWEVISELYARTNFLEALARKDQPDQLLANARKLLMLAVEQPEVGPREFAESVREIQRISHRESQASTFDEDADVVRIMTIHKSKGLEFPIVVVPETLKTERDAKKDLVFDPRLSLVATGFGGSIGMTASWLAHRQQARERDEEWRVLYVAMTRAEKLLCLIIHESKSNPSPGGQIAKLLSVEGEPYLPGMVVRRYGVGKLES